MTKRILSLVLLLIATLPCARAQPDTSQAERCVRRYAAHYRIPPELIAALIDVESRWNPRAVSDKGAMGLMQLMPATARRFGAFHPFDVDEIYRRDSISLLEHGLRRSSKRRSQAQCKRR
ncbi:MAG: transglycosylase SLT domain-containing protein [Terracidiphilus sp.]